MQLYIGVDLGTSAMKLLLVDKNGRIHNTVSLPYPLSFPKPGWSEQHPHLWRDALLQGVPQLLQGFDAADVAAIGCAGQMHGLVILDAQDKVIRPAILWNDGRTEDQVTYLNETVGRDVLTACTGNIAFAGFTAPKLLWLRENEPESFARIAKVMLPKDYINYLLTGVHSCDMSDASGMLLLDVQNRCWSEKMLQLCGLRREQMPTLFESFAPIGTLREDMAAQLGLPRDVVVCAGAGDNAAAAVGTGTVGNGACNISLGTSGTVFIVGDRYAVDPYNALHAFAHADGGYHLMGCMLSAAACNQWLMENILHGDDYSAEQAQIAPEKLGENHVYFLPYLMGERSPINDTRARGTLVGMTLDTTRADMVQAVLEGVAFALRDSVEVARSLGYVLPQTMLCGGGARSDLWKVILANVLQMELLCPQSEQGPGLGAAMLAMVAHGAYPTVQAVCDALCSVAERIRPDAALQAKYEARYQNFRKIYPACKDLFAAME